MDPKPWSLHWSVIGFPCLVWTEDDGTRWYKSHPFAGRQCWRQPDDKWEWLDIGDVASFTDIGFAFHLGHDGELKQFKSEQEAMMYSAQWDLEHKGVTDFPA